MPDASLIMQFVYQVAGTVVLWGATFIVAFLLIIYFYLRFKELLP